MINPYVFEGLSMPMDFGARANMFNIGDSISLGQAASPATTNGWWYRARNAWIGSGGTNGAVSGRGFWRGLSVLLGASYSISGTILTEMCGFNDEWRGNSPAGTENPKTLKKAEAYARCVVGKTIIGTTAASGSSSVTRTGGPFVNFNASNEGGVYGGTGTIPANVATRIAAGNTGTWSYSFTGDGVCVAFICSDGVVATYGSVEIWVDSVQVDTVNCDGWNDGISDVEYGNQYIPLWMTYHGFGSGSHTVEVRKTSSTGSITVDFLSPVKDPGDANNTLLIGTSIPHMSSTGYTSLGGGSDSFADTLSAKKKQIYKMYFDRGYTHIRYVDVNRWYHTTNINADGIHPDTTGHLEIFNAVNTIKA